MRIDWSATSDGTLVELELRGSHVYFEIGPREWPARGHEGAGGTVTIDSIRREPERILAGFPGLYDEVMTAVAQRNRIVDAPNAVLETTDEDGAPHTVTVPFLVDGDRAYIPIGHPALEDDAAQRLLAETGSTPAVRLLVTGAVDGQAWSARLTGTASVLVDERGYHLRDVVTWLEGKYPELVDHPPRTILWIELEPWWPPAGD